MTYGQQILVTLHVHRGTIDGISLFSTILYIIYMYICGATIYSSTTDVPVTCGCIDHGCSRLCC